MPVTKNLDQRVAATGRALDCRSADRLPGMGWAGIALRRTTSGYGPTSALRHRNSRLRRVRSKPSKALTCVTVRHMKHVSLRELREKTGSLIRDARRLAGPIVTDRGAPIARIEPIDSRPAPNPFLSRKLLPADQRLLRSGRLGRGTDGARIVSDNRDGR